MITERTKAILLFTTYLFKDADKKSKPLSLTEWNKLVRWLTTKNISPEDFLSQNPELLLSDWKDQSISRTRLLDLLERKTALALALDKWTKAGVWIMTRGDSDYPAKLKERLKDAAPNLLFGIGNRALLKQNFIGVVGSRNVSDEDLDVARDLSAKVQSQKYGIVSGGARGVDEAAMFGVLEREGGCVGVMADSLIKKSTTQSYRKYILENKLVLVSPYNPEAGFNAGNAMGRNKLIYTLSDISIVIRSDTKGGTWEGAKENLKNKWVPLLVYKSDEKGNAEIVKMGGRWLPDQDFNLRKLIEDASSPSPDANLFSSVNQTDSCGNGIENGDHKLEHGSEINGTHQPDSHKSDSSSPLFQLFITSWSHCFQNEPVTKSHLEAFFDLTSQQVERWLSKALAERLIVEEKNTESFWLVKERIVQVNTSTL